jgi:hypothetical protein
MGGFLGLVQYDHIETEIEDVKNSFYCASKVTRRTKIDPSLGGRAFCARS